jgi:hypothetical protein
MTNHKLIADPGTKWDSIISPAAFLIRGNPQHLIQTEPFSHFSCLSLHATCSQIPLLKQIQRNILLQSEVSQRSIYVNLGSILSVQGFDQKVW